MGEEYTFKLIVAGDGGVGKTTLVKKWVEGLFDASQKMTIGLDIFKKEMVCGNGIKSVLSIWDLGGQKRFQFFLDNFTKGADGIIYCFDLTRASSFENLWWWRDIIKKHKRDFMPSILIGTKHDLVDTEHPIIPNDLIEMHVKKHHLINYFETSAMTGYNVENMFKIINEAIIRYYRSDIQNDITEVAQDLKMPEEEIKKNYLDAIKKEIFS